MIRKRIIVLLGLLCLSATQLLAQGLDTSTKKGDWEEINFAFDRAVLTDGYPSLLRLADLLNKHADFRVKLWGHADHMGSNDYNIRLGRQRAEMVRDFLVKYGARQSQISAESYGEQQPTADNEKREGRWMNRRVNVTVSDGQGNIISDGGISDAIASLDDLLKAQEECCSKILKKLEDLDKLDDILAMLKGLKNENDNLRDEIGKLKHDHEGLERKVAAAPATREEVRDIVKEAAYKPGKKRVSQS